MMPARTEGPVSAGRKSIRPLAPITASLPLPAVMVSLADPPMMKASPPPSVIELSPPTVGSMLAIWASGRSAPSVLSPGPP